MSSEKSLSWFGRKREERALILCKEHMDLILDVTAAMRDTFYSFAEGATDLTEKSREVEDKERRADEKKAEVLERVSHRNFPQVSAEAIIRLVMEADDIAENARAGAEKVVLLNSEDVDEEVRKGLRQLTDYAYECVELLRETFLVSLHDNLDTAIEKTKEVEKMEEKVDHYRAETLLPKIISWANKSEETGDSILLVQIESNIEEVVDEAENSADVIRQIVVGAMR